MKIEDVRNGFDPPLFAKTGEMTKLFGLSRTTLFRMRRDHPDFDALTITVGGSVLYDVPRCYQWFQDRCGDELD